MQSIYPHQLLIQKDGILQLEVNEEKEPELIGVEITYKSFCDLHKQWQSKHQYIQFASEDESNKVLKHISGFGKRFDFVDLSKEHRILVDCVEIRDGKAYFKQPIAETESQDAHNNIRLTIIDELYSMTEQKSTFNLDRKDFHEFAKIVADKLNPKQ